MKVTVHEARSQLSRLLKLAEEGETVTIVRRGIPVARLTPVPPATDRQLGWDAAGAVPDSSLDAWTDGKAEHFLRGA